MQYERMLLAEFIAFSLALGLTITVILNQVVGFRAKSLAAEVYLNAPLDLRRCELEMTVSNSCSQWSMDYSRSKYEYSDDQSTLYAHNTRLNGTIALMFEPVTPGSRYIRLRCHSETPGLAYHSCKKEQDE